MTPGTWRPTPAVDGTSPARRDGSACPACWISMEGLPVADIKGLLALGDLSVTIADLQ